MPLIDKALSSPTEHFLDRAFSICSHTRGAILYLTGPRTGCTHSRQTVVGYAMADRDFLIEEYRALRDGIRLHQNAYFALESYVFGGALVAYGILFGLTRQSPNQIILAAWWAIPAILSIACVRCWGHYLIVRKISLYLEKIENRCSVSSDIPGFENYHRTTAPGPKTHLLVNALSWGALIIGSTAIAVFETAGWTIP